MVLNCEDLLFVSYMIASWMFLGFGLLVRQQNKQPNSSDIED